MVLAVEVSGVKDPVGKADIVMLVIRTLVAVIIGIAVIGIWVIVGGERSLLTTLTSTVGFSKD